MACKNSAVPEDLLKNIPEVLVAFDAIKTVGSTIIYFSKSRANGEYENYIFDKYSYVVGPITVSRKDCKSKVFYAERYGGDFISRNGGGGRCGYDGLFSVKGIGKTPLVGPSVDDFHSNGMLDLESAIHELIWGEVIHKILPHGAARSVAVIKLEEKFVIDGVTHQRALLVRESVVRPAHFERAPLYKEKISGGAALCKDAIRVKAAIKQITDFLPRLADQDSSHYFAGDTVSQLRSGLTALSIRFAEQFAVARCKNIMHMMMSSSNLTMSGAWLDLNSATVVSHMSVREKRLYQSFHSEHQSAIKSLTNICYYAHRYLPLTSDTASQILFNALAEFDKSYEKTLRACVLIRLGFPKYVIAKSTGRVEFTYWSNRLLHLLRQESYGLGSQRTCGELDFYSLPDRPYVKDCVVNNGMLDIPIDWCVSSGCLNDQLNKEFDFFVSVLVQESAVPRNELLRLVCINMTRRSRTPLLLQNVKLYEYIRSCIENAKSDVELREKISCLMERSKDAAEIFLATDEGFSSLAWRNGPDFIKYSGETGKFHISSGGRLQLATWAQLDALQAELPIAHSAIDFYQDVKGAFVDA